MGTLSNVAYGTYNSSYNDTNEPPSKPRKPSSIAAKKQLPIQFQGLFVAPEVCLR